MDSAWAKGSDSAQWEEWADSLAPYKKDRLLSYHWHLDDENIALF